MLHLNLECLRQMFAIANSETSETVLKILNLHEKMKIANIWKKNLFVGCRKTAEHCYIGKTAMANILCKGNRKKKYEFLTMNRKNLRRSQLGTWGIPL